MTDPVYEFMRDMSARGLSPHKESIVADGKLHRYRVSGDRAGKENGWYVLHLDGIPAGAFGSWKTGEQHNWCSKSANELTPEEREANKQRMEATRKAREAETEMLRAAAKDKAESLWDKAHEGVDAGHVYIKDKAITPFGARQLGKMIVIKIRDEYDELHSLQFILPDGSKRYLSNGRKAGCFNLIKGDSSKPIYICEGWATGCSIRSATGANVAVCFDSGNLKPVAESLKRIMPDNDFVICADDDFKTMAPVVNPGITKAAEAAAAIGAPVFIPKFGDARPDRATDFNDMHQLYGLDAVRECLSGESSNMVDLNARRKTKLASDVEKEKGATKQPSGKKGADIDWNRYKRILDRYALIYGTETCIDIDLRMIMKVRDFRLAVTNDYANMWLKSPSRRTILPKEVVFDPSCQSSGNEINLYRGFDIKPKQGNFSAIQELLLHLCAESAESDAGVYEVMDWVLKWIALPLQRPGAKMRTALVFHGPQGTGKNLFFEIIAAIYGCYSLIVGQEQLESSYNDWMSQKLFLIGDEVIARQELFHQKNKLKAFITGETIQVNPKFLPLRTEKNHINVVFLSNEDQPLALEPSDRRYLVVYTPPQRHDDLYDQVSMCIKNGGIEAFYHHLLSLDLSDFNEHTKPIMTVAKADLIELGMKPAQKFLYDWVRGFLPLPLVGCSVDQLYRAFEHWMKLYGGKWAPDKNQFGSTAKKAMDMLSDKFNSGDKIMITKPVRLPSSYDGQTMVRMWIPQQGTCRPKEGEKLGEWAVGAIDAFESALKKYKAGESGV
ncbi:putative DNA primase/helicase [Nitrosomonas aestuarii]|uniref:Putative DNA primase/helicase n=1 Tax=Nitrosomonas aestuarii TaxID=52441 RepID=A0A1I4C3P1_9PROT|nr:DUF5906 domain-containing protein [Nitrosomonas aestuarii]SFK74949.1 putative DNA primase/helicase [Nitrosomonas aestuarii]